MAFMSDFGLGTLISNMSEVYGSGQRRHKEDIERRNEQADFDRSRMAPDMMAKVEAAKAAGLHPLTVIGGGGSFAQGSPILSATPPPPPRRALRLGNVRTRTYRAIIAPELILRRFR